MALDITQREREDVVILDLKGRITVGPEATTLRETVSALKPATGAQSGVQSGRRGLHRLARA